MVFDPVKGRDGPKDYKKFKELLREIWERFHILGEISHTKRDLGEIIDKEK